MNGARSVQIGSPDQIDRLIAACATHGLVGRVQLLRAVRRGEINIAEPARDAVVGRKVLERSARPLVVILGDDDYAATGPGGWAALPRLVRWARGALIHATGADAATYEMAIGMALAVRRFLLVEADSGHAAAWGEALRAARVGFVCLVPPDGPHPLPLDRGTIQ